MNRTNRWLSHSSPVALTLLLGSHQRMLRRVRQLPDVMKARWLLSNAMIFSHNRSSSVSQSTSI